MSLSGQKAGWITIEEPLGHGTMGDVYLGFHEKLKRKVAVKTVVQEKRLKERAKARFLREARALSRLDHPNICKIYDYVEEEDYDLLVLELIEGLPLKQIMKGKLTTNEKFRIAEQLADALAAAHAKGVIHRDIKPDNVMITHEGVVKVLDFGISRTERKQTLPGASWDDSPSEAGATSADLKTRDGILMGTLSYMSPEQARGETATAASDIYALGLLAQELFTGSRPYPSGITFPVLLRKAAAGETEAVEGLDEDLTRLIERLKDPIPEARPSGGDTVERFRLIAEKPARRRRKLLGWAAIAALAAFSMMMTWQAWRIREEARRANLEATRASQAAMAAGQVSEYLVDLFELMDPDQALGNEVTARELLDRGAARLDYLSGPALDRARLLFTMGRLYRKLGTYDRARPLLEQSLELRRANHGDTHLDVADCLIELAEIHCYQDHFQEGISLAERALSIRNRVLGEEHLAATADMLVLSRLHWELRDFEKALSLAEKARAIREAGLPADHPDIGVALSWLAGIHDDMGKYSSAKRVAIRAINILEKSANRIDLIDALNILAMIHSQEGRYNEAGPLYTRAFELAKQTLGSEHPRLGGLLNNIAVLYDNQELHEEALDYYFQAMAIWEKAYGPNHSSIAMALSNIALSYVELQQYEKALETQRRVVAIHKAVYGPHSGALAIDYLTMASALAGMGKISEARSMYGKALAMIDLVKNIDIDLVGANIDGLADDLLDLKYYPDAEKLFRYCLVWWERAEEPVLSDKIHDLDQLTLIMRATDREKEARALETQARELREQENSDSGS